MAIKKVTEEITLQPSDAEIPEDRIAELRRKAQAEALEARRKKLEDDAYKIMLEEERARLDPADEVVEIDIDVPIVNIVDPWTQAPGVCIDGVRYMMERDSTGAWAPKSYRMGRKRAEMINHAIHKAWFNEIRAGHPNRDTEHFKRPHVSAIRNQAVQV